MADTLRTCNVFLGTWNVNSKAPGGTCLKKWLTTGSAMPPDLYVIGFQEVNVRPESEREQEWL